MRFALPLILLATTPVAAQVPQGWYAFGTFAGATSPLTKGISLAHPRNPAASTPVTGLLGDLVVTGSASILYRESDDVLIVGERSPVNSSVDLHVLRLSGSAVVHDASFSVGTGGPCCGEIPQMALLPDGRVLVAATDLAAGPLKNYLTTRYGWQGLGIVDTSTGSVTSIPISNGATIVDVFNALALSPDGNTAYIGTYVANTSGDIWSVPIPGGGPATLVINLPGGISNMAFDNAGFLMVTDAYTTQALYRVDLSNSTFSTVVHSSGPLNGIACETVTGNFAIVTGGAGTPARSVFWMEQNGTDHLLDSPTGIATPSGVAVRSNPARYGTATAAANSYDWQLKPNPGGLPLLGNAGFSMTVRTTGSATTVVGIYLIAAERLATPLSVVGVNIWVDVATLLVSGIVLPAPSATIPLPLPNDTSLAGLQLSMQTLELEAGGAFGATPAAQFTLQ